MMKSIKNIFTLTNKYIILATPLILFVLMSNLYAIISASGNLLNLLFALLLLFFMTAAFLAGWFTMVKKAVSDEYPNETNKIIKDFVSGVGEYFLPSLGGLACTTIISIIFIVLAFALGNHIIGDIGVTSNQLSVAMNSPADLKLFLASLSSEQLMKINQWNILLLLTMFIDYFLLIFYFPAIFYKTKNPIIALYYGLKDLFSKKFFLVFAAVFFIALSYLFLSALSTLTMQNIVVHFLVTMISFYLMIALTIGIFDFYNRKFVLSHLGQNIDEVV